MSPPPRNLGPLTRPVNYLACLTGGRLVLWCYFVWYLFILALHFRPDPRLWLTAVGLSAVIGSALLINTTRSGKVPVKLEPWPTFRLFVTPFCVSSFSALVSGRRFILIFPPGAGELAAGLSCVAAFCAAVYVSKLVCGREAREPPPV